MPRTADEWARRLAGRPIGWWVDALCLASFAAITWALFQGYLLGVDLAVRDWSDEHRPTFLYVVAVVGNLLGQGGFFTLVSLLLALILVYRWRTAWPLVPVVGAFALTFVSITVLKDWTDRAAPHAHVRHPERFDSDPTGVSYPSGHLANSIVWYGVLTLLSVLLFGVRRITARWQVTLRLAPPAILMVTTTYLAYHWVTDSVAGLLLGIVLDRLRRRLPEINAPT
jgi:membrane-associated phospholipid phosphatase